ncbi:MAG: aldo/keto reductase [Anaerolineales bacterium]|nr:aldo/keto reductase [Anaerolineales bacterium]
MAAKVLPGGEPIAPIGLGTWAIGGHMSANRRHDRESISTIEAALEMGYSHIDTAEMYAGGHTEELVGQAIRRFDREKLFITTKVSPGNLRFGDIQKSMEASLRRLGSEYVDLYLIHWPNERIPLEESFQALNALVESGKTRYLGVSNFNLDQVRRAEAASNTPIATNQVPYSLQTKEYEKNGVLDYCRKQGIIVTAYSPIKSVNLRHRTLARIGNKYGATPAQIALAWVINQPAVITIPKSSNMKRLKENFDSRRLRIEAEDMLELGRM